MCKQQEFKPEELSAVIWAASQTCPSFDSFFQVAIGACGERLPKFSMNAVAHLVKNLAPVQTNAPDLYVTLLRQSLEHCPQLQPASLVTLFQGAATAATNEIYADQNEVMTEAVSQACNEIMARIQEFKKSEIQLVSDILRDPVMGAIIPCRKALEQVLQKMVLASSAEFDFSLTGTDDGQPVTIDAFYFSVLDLDEGKRMKLREGVTVDGYATSYLTEDTEIKTTVQGNGVTLFESSMPGNGKDNPKDPELLNERQKNRAVTFLFDRAHLACWAFHWEWPSLWSQLHVRWLKQLNRPLHNIVSMNDILWSAIEV